MTRSNLVFIVDDSDDYRWLLQQLFQRSLPGYRVRFFSGGQVVLHTLFGTQEKPRQIVLDRHMPGLDGDHTLLQVKQHPDLRTIPVVIMSAEATAETVEACYQAGANSFLVKEADWAATQQTMTAICHYWLDLNR